MKLLDGNSRECEIKPCLAYWDGVLNDPICFPAKIQGTLAEEPRGDFKNYHWSELSKIFIPKGYDKTEGELSEEDYDFWRKEADISVSSFGKWLRDTSSC